MTIMDEQDVRLTEPKQPAGCATRLFSCPTTTRAITVDLSCLNLPISFITSPFPRFLKVRGSPAVFRITFHILKPHNLISPTTPLYQHHLMKHRETASFSITISILVKPHQ